MPQKYLMAIVIAAAVILSNSIYSRGDGFPPGNIDIRVPLLAKIHTTVTLFDKDSTNLYTLFDGLLDRNCTLIFVFQPYFWSADKAVDSAIVLPFPVMVAGEYLLRIGTPDSTYARRFVWMGR